MKKYEYMKKDVSELDGRHGLISIGKLNELGNEGWELVCVNSGEYVFKREKQ